MIIYDHTWLYIYIIIYICHVCAHIYPNPHYFWISCWVHGDGALIFNGLVQRKNLESRGNHGLQWSTGFPVNLPWTNPLRYWWMEAFRQSCLETNWMKESVSPHAFCLRILQCIYIKPAWYASVWHMPPARPFHHVSMGSGGGADHPHIYIYTYIYWSNSLCYIYTVYTHSS